MDDDDNKYTITISDIDMDNIDGLTVGGVSTNSVYTTGSYSSIDVSSITFDPDYNPGIDVTSGDLTVHEEGDIKIGGRSLKTFIDTMEKRMAILQPDPNKLEKFEALRKAYEHYKTIEALCHDETPDDEAIN